METKVNYTIVGAFVIILFSFIVIGVIWLSSGLSVGKYQIFQVYMSESVSGLNVDSAVEFNGVNVGSVKSIAIDQKDPHIVLLLLNVSKTTPVSKGTRATVNTKGFTGIAYIALVDQGNDLTPLEPAKGQDYPIIATSPSFFWRLDTGMHKLGEDLTKVSKAIEGLLDEENLHSIKEILIDMRHITRTLATNTEQLHTILQNTAQASQQFTPLLQSSENMIRTLNSQILPSANQAMMNLDLLTENLSQLTIELRQNPAVIIRGRTPAPLGPGEK